jgi:glycosyltransferase 2 family protein
VRAAHARAFWWRLGLYIVAAVVATVLVIWRGPSWSLVADAFTLVVWEWVVVAIGFNLVSVVVRALGWRVVIHHAMPPPHPSFRTIFSAFSVGLFANAALPGRVGELARVAVLTRRVPQARGDAWATLVGTVVAHRVFDLVAVVLLILYVTATARIPAWAITSLLAIVAIGATLLAFAVISARRHHRPIVEELGPVRRIVTMLRQGLGIMRAPRAAAAAFLFQALGWFSQLLAVWATMRAFQIEEPLAAAGLVLLLMNVATIFPLWPGNIGLLQAAVAIPLVSYGIAYTHGFAFGIGLQAIEASVGVGVGLLFLAREGLSYAMLKTMPDASQAELPHREEELIAQGPMRREREPEHERARIAL